MTGKKNKLDTVILEGLDAEANRAREEMLLEILKREQQYLSENADAIDAALPFDEPIDEAHPLFDRNDHSMNEDKPTVGEAVSKIAAAFDNAFAAFVSDVASNLKREMPTLLAAGVRGERDAYLEKAGKAPGQEIIGRNEGMSLPNWMPWPPVEDSRTAGTWVFFVDWYGRSGAPTSAPRMLIRVDGEDVDDPVVSVRNKGERVEFKVHCPKPLGFELEELSPGTLRMNLMTEEKNLS